MRNPARFLIVATLASCLELLTACGQDCGEGTVLRGDACVPVSFACGAGTVLAGGVCVAEVEACGEGTALDATACVLDDGSVVCGAGTQWDVLQGRCVATVASACGANTIAVDATCEVSGRLQIIHAIEAANASAVDLYIDGALAVNDFAYRTGTRFIEVASGAHAIGIALPDSGNVIGAPIPESGAVETTVTVSPVTDTVAVLRGVDTASFGAGSRQLPRSVATDSLAFAFVHAAPDAPSPVDLENEGPDHDSESDDTTLVNDTAFGSASQAVTMEAARFVLGVADGGGNDVLRFRASWENLGGTAFTLVASGFVAAPSDDRAFALLLFSRDGGAGVALPLFD